MINNFMNSLYAYLWSVLSIALVGAMCGAASIDNDGEKQNPLGWED